MSVDLYVEQMMPCAKLVIGPTLGEAPVVAYGVDEITTACKSGEYPASLGCLAMIRLRSCLTGCRPSHLRIRIDYGLIVTAAFGIAAQF